MPGGTPIRTGTSIALVTTTGPGYGLAEIWLDGVKQLIDQPGRVEVRRSPGSALLDPMRFAPRLIASSARIIDWAFEILNLGSDPRLDDQPSLEPAHLQWPFRPNDREVLLMTSPLSGLL